MGDVLLGVMDNRPEGRKPAQNDPLAENKFPLDSWPDFGESRFATTRISPVSTGTTARHWRALLFLGCFISAEWQGKTRQPRRVNAECESFSDSCRD